MSEEGGRPCRRDGEEAGGSGGAGALDAIVSFQDLTGPDAALFRTGVASPRVLLRAGGSMEVPVTCTSRTGARSACW